MGTTFTKQYPDFAAIEQHIRRAHAERSVAIASAFATGVIATVRGIGQLFAGKHTARTGAGGVLVKANVRAHAARV